MNWSSPGGLYVVPDGFRRRFLSEFPGYRIRWSLKKQHWMVEQPFGSGALPPLRIDPADDSLVRAKDGFWLVMSFQPGDRMPCPYVLDKLTGKRCGWTMKVPTRETGEAVCDLCRKNGRDGKTMAAYWPFDECLLEQLRFTDPRTGGVKRASKWSDLANAAIEAEADWRRRDAGTLDQVDYRWLTGIGASSAKSRHIDAKTFR